MIGLPLPPGNPHRNIFGPRPEPPPIVSPSPFLNANNRIRQSPTAEQILKNSAFVLTNIESCRNRIRQLKQKMTPYFEPLHELRGFSQILIKSELPEFARTVFRRPRTLNLYHRHLLTMAQIINLYTQFRISTPINSSIDISVRPARQSQQQLEQHISTLKALHQNLQQRLYEYQYDMSEQIQPPIRQLEEYLKIHENDINVLVNIEQLELTNTFEKFKKYYNQNDMAYSRFKTIEDCIGAMDVQPKTMKNKINTMKEHFGNIIDDRYDDAIRATKTLYDEMVRLERLYQSNFQRMVREGSEATFPEYHQKLKEYQENKGNFVKEVKQFRQLVKIFDRLTQIKRNSQEVGRRVVSHYQQVDINKLKKLYSQATTIDTNGSEVQKYKSAILISMQKDLNKAGCNEITKPMQVTTSDAIRQTIIAVNNFFNKLGNEKSSQFLMQTIRQQDSWLNQCRKKTINHPQSSAILKDLKIYLDISLNLSQNLIYLHDPQYLKLRDSSGSPFISKIIKRLFEFLSINSELRGLPPSLELHLFQNLIDMNHISVPAQGYNRIEDYIANGMNLLDTNTLYHIYSISDYNKRIKNCLLDSLYNIDKLEQGDEFWRLAYKGSINIDILPKIMEKMNVPTGIEGLIRLKMLHKMVFVTPPSIKKKNYLILLSHMSRLMQNLLISQKLLSDSERYLNFVNDHQRQGSLKNQQCLVFFNLVVLVLQEQQQLQMTVMPQEDITQLVQKYATSSRKQCKINVQFGGSLSRIRKIMQATIAINEINQNYEENRCHNMTLLYNRINKIAQCVEQPTNQDRIRFGDSVLEVKSVFSSNFQRFADWVAFVKSLYHYKDKQFTDIPSDLFMKEAIEKVFKTQIPTSIRFPIPYF